MVSEGAASADIGRGIPESLGAKPKQLVRPCREIAMPNHLTFVCFGSFLPTIEPDCYRRQNLTPARVDGPKLDALMFGPIEI
jgi:hypothetical protein